jgi:hypothetical protein
LIGRELSEVGRCAEPGAGRCRHGAVASRRKIAHDGFAAQVGVNIRGLTPKANPEGHRRPILRGGGAGREGTSVMQTPMSNSRLTDPEVPAFGMAGGAPHPVLPPRLRSAHP